MSRLDTLERNWLINGAFDLFQMVYSNPVNITGTLSYLNADMFRIAYSGTVTGTPTAIRSTDVPSNGKSLNSLNLRCQRNASSVTLSAQQRIASFDAIELSNEVISLSTQYKFPVATQIEVVLSIPTVVDNYTSETVIHTQSTVVTADNTWRLFTLEGITLPNVSNGLGVRFNIILPSGTDGAIVNHLLTQIKLNKGYKALGFSRAGARFNDEVTLCQQFLEKSYDPTVDPGAVTQPGSIDFQVPTSGANTMYISTRFLVQKRTTPIVTLYSPTSGAINTIATSAGNETASVVSPSVNSFFGGTTGTASKREIAYQFVADARI